jgi:hypothetical protein
MKSVCTSLSLPQGLTLGIRVIVDQLKASIQGKMGSLIYFVFDEKEVFAAMTREHIKKMLTGQPDMI